MLRSLPFHDIILPIGKSKKFLHNYEGGVIVYQYFIGKRSNLRTKSPEQPIVIEVDSIATSKIEHWLDKYSIDFDVLVNAMKSILRVEPEKFTWEDVQNFVVHLEDGTLAFAEMLEQDGAKLELHVEEDEYTFCLGEDYFVESCIQQVENMKFGADVNEKSIYIANENTLLCISTDTDLEELYSEAKRNIEELEIWDNLACVMCWIRGLPVAISTYDLAIISNDGKHLGTVKLKVVNERIVKYVHINEFGEYRVYSDASWYATFHDFTFRYDTQEKKCKVSFKRGTKISISEYKVALEYVKDLIAIMQKTMQLINDTFEQSESIK